MPSKHRNGAQFSGSVSMVTVITAYIYRPSISKELRALHRHAIFYRREKDRGTERGRKGE